MPRLGVDALRWLLLLLNLGALAGAAFLGLSLAGGPDDQLRKNLPEPAKFEVPPEVERVFDRRQVQRIETLWKKVRPKPPAPRDPNPPPILDQGPVGGPLSGWEVAYVIDPPGSAPRGCSIQEKQVESSIPNAGASTRRTASSRGRTPSNRTRNVRRSGRRVAAPQQQVGRSRYVREGGTFKVDDVVYTAVKILVSDEGEELEYTDPTGRSFVILRESYPDSENYDEETGVLTGLSADDLEPDTPGVPEAQPAVPTDRRGSIQRTATPQRTTPNRRTPAASTNNDTSRSPAAQRRQAANAAEQRRKADAQKAEAQSKIDELKKSGQTTPEEKKALEKASETLKRADERGPR